MTASAAASSPWGVLVPLASGVGVGSGMRPAEADGSPPDCSVRPVSAGELQALSRTTRSAISARLRVGLRRPTLRPYTSGGPTAKLLGDKLGRVTRRSSSRNEQATVESIPTRNVDH